MIVSKVGSTSSDGFQRWKGILTDNLSVLFRGDRRVILISLALISAYTCAYYRRCDSFGESAGFLAGRRMRRSATASVADAPRPAPLLGSNSTV